MSDDSMPGAPDDGPNPEHLAVLRQGLEVWNLWREQNPDIRPNLFKADLKRFILWDANLQGTDLEGANLEGAWLSLANLRGALIRQARLGNALLGGANLSGADLEESQLSWADLYGADLTGAYLAGADLEGAILEGADLVGGELARTVNLTQDQINVANGNWVTSLPHGMTYPDHWAKEPEAELDTGTSGPPKPSLPTSPSPVPMAWSVAGKITVVPPRERPPAHGLSPETRDLLAWALTDAAADLAEHIRSGNSDQNIANRLDAYARECAKGGAQLNVLRLDAIIRTLSGLVRNDTDALSAIDSQEYSVFADDHDRLTRFYPDFEDYQRALASAPNIPAPPNLDLAKLLREPPGPDIIDVSIPDAIDDILPRGESLPDSRRTDTQETNERKFSLMKIVEGLKLALEMPGAAVSAIAAIRRLYAILKPLFDWLMLIF